MAFGVIDLTTSSGMIDAVKQELNRRDLDNQVPSFIVRAEAKFNRELRVRDMQTRIRAMSANEYIDLPSDYLATFTLEIGQGSPQYWGQPIRFMSEEEARTWRAANPANGCDIVGYTVWGNSFELVSAPTQPVDFRLKYYAKIPSLIQSLPTFSNWLLVKSPDLYIAGACLEASLYLKGDQRLTTWNAVRTQIMDAMKIESDQARFPQNKLAANRSTFG